MHCVKSVHIRSFSGPYFSAFGLSVRQKNSEYGHILHSDDKSKTAIKSKIQYLSLILIYPVLVMATILKTTGLASCFRLNEIMPLIFVFCLNYRLCSRSMLRTSMQLIKHINQADQTFRSSCPKVFLGKGVMKICSKFTGEHPCRSVISTKSLCNFIEKHFSMDLPL